MAGDARRTTFSPLPAHRIWATVLRATAGQTKQTDRGEGMITKLTSLYVRQNMQDGVADCRLHLIESLERFLGEKQRILTRVKECSKSEIRRHFVLQGTGFVNRPKCSTKTPGPQQSSTEGKFSLSCARTTPRRLTFRSRTRSVKSGRTVGCYMSGFGFFFLILIILIQLAKCI